MSDEKETQPPTEPSTVGEMSTPAPETRTVELGESVRKGTQVMPELSVPQNFDPPTAAPIVAAPASDPGQSVPAAPASGGDGSSGPEK
jgi:hypothetical protein